MFRNHEDKLHELDQILKHYIIPEFQTVKYKEKYELLLQTYQQKQQEPDLIPKELVDEKVS